MNKKYLKIAAICGFIAVIAGAFGAHALREVLTDTQLNTWQTAVQYQFYHTLALLLICSNLINENKWLNYAANSFFIGILLFSGSLYLLSLKDLIGLNSVSILGPITPIGGVFFILGWIFTFIAASKK